jgi:hypothetical protein
MPQRYEVRHQGPAIICGGAPSVFVDLEKALEIHPQATILGVNNAAAMIPQIEHVWTQHNNFAHQYKASAGRPISVHARAGIMGNDVDYVWQSMVGMKGSSGVVAAIWARHMGFDRVVLAGIPMSQSNALYTDKYPGKTADLVFSNPANIEHWQKFVRLHKDEGRMDGVSSMSGYTRQVLGAPC